MKTSNLIFKSPIRFAQGWEDHRVIEEGLNIKKGQIIASVLASGDNVLNLLLLEPLEIYVFDVSDAQIYEVKLKLAAIKNLNYKDFLKIIGYDGKNKERIKIFYSISGKLDDETLSFWIKNIKIVKRGVAFNGWWEKYSASWKYVIKSLLGRDFKRYIESGNILERRKIFEKRINKKSLRFFSKIFTLKFFTNIIYQKHAVKNIPNDFDLYKNFWNTLKHFFVDIECNNNPYHYWVFTGQIPKNQNLLQPYLQEKNFKFLKENLDKIKINKNDFYNGLKVFNENYFDAFYLSDIFSWMNIEEMQNTLFEVIRVAKNKSKIISFVLNHDKNLPEKVKKYINIDEEKSKELLLKERVGLYSKINIWTIKK